MSWMAKLYDTYEAGVLLDLPDEQKLMPTSHTLQNAHLNIVIDGEGNFIRATVLEKTQIVLPATESSASRSSGEAPHPLADKLQYVAQDYAAYGGLKKAYFAGYETQLATWCHSDYSHPKANAVLRYVQKGHVIQDLIQAKLVFVDDENKLLTSWTKQVDTENPVPTLFRVLPKEKGILDQGSALVCWTVEVKGDPNRETWKDKSLQDSWVAFDNAGDSVMGLCYVTGETLSLSVNHPAKIRHSGDKAKLISSNDTSGYTYRGRFLDDKEACGIGFDVSQKAHNALRWLIARQGFRNGDQAFVSWAVSGKSFPQPLQDTVHLLADDDFDEVTLTSQQLAKQDEQAHTIDHGIDIGHSFARLLKKYMAGYHAKLSPNEQILVMGIDAATPGRMGVIYYRELLGSEFLEQLEKWHYQFAWAQRLTIDVPSELGKKPAKKTIWPISCPAPLAIAEAAYGQRLSDALKKSVIERLTPCIIDGAAFPIDLMNACVRMATNRSGYKSDEQWLWEKNLGIACAVYRGFCLRTNRGSYDMELEKTRTTRSYLYGRLLAYADAIEGYALHLADEKRETNAARFFQRFADRPAATWLQLNKDLKPYRTRLQSRNPDYLDFKTMELEVIYSLFQPDDFESNVRLEPEFLLGYNLQRHELRPKAKTLKVKDANSTDSQINQGENS